MKVCILSFLYLISKHRPNGSQLDHTMFVGLLSTDSLSLNSYHQMQTSRHMTADSLAP